MAISAELRRELLNLTAEERAELADELYESVAAAQDPAWEQAWSTEIQQRVSDVANGTVELADADDVHRELRDELRDARR